MVLSQGDSASTLLRDRILSCIQTGFPLEGRPYAVLALEFGSTEDEIHTLVCDLRSQGTIRRIGATFEPACLGYVSTLAAVAVENPARIEHTAAFINQFPEVTHNYLRDDYYNLWFTVIASSRERIAAVLATIARETGCAGVLDLPAIRIFKIRVNFDLAGLGDVDYQQRTVEPALVATPSLTSAEKSLVRALQGDIGTSFAPFATLALQEGCDEEELLGTIKKWKEQGLVRRFGAVVRHRQMGFSSNAMCVWDVDDDQVVCAGELMASFKEVSHCYERPRRETWRGNLYTMIHGQTHEECRAVVARIVEALAEARIAVSQPRLLYSSREFKKRSMRYFVEDE